jgi:adenine-specific DNA-methyltransferase
MLDELFVFSDLYFSDSPFKFHEDYQDINASQTAKKYLFKILCILLVYLQPNSIQKRVPTLNWIGKEKVVHHHQDVPFRILEHQYGFTQKGEQKKPTNSGNLIIHGDNLEALKALLPEYEGRVDVIYIDPPYNTGNENWIYNDNVNDPKIKKWLGQVVGRESEDLSRNDKWLCMMYPRLKLLHKLLADNGAIFISIDDNEVSYLRMIMDEIFGFANFRNHIILKRGTKSVQAQFDNIDKLGIACEYLVCYTKTSKHRLPQFYFDLEETKQGSWNNHWRGTDRPTMRYELFGITPESGQWRWGKERSENAINNYKVCVSELNQLGLELNQENIDKWYLNKNSEIDLLRLSKNNKPEHYIAPTDKKFGHNLWTDLLVNGTADYSKYTDTKFDNPKNPKIVERIVNWVGKPNSIILDSFAGSGTTAHAVLNLNKQDGGNRKFICIEMEDYAETITAERVKRVIQGYGKTEGTEGSFDYYELGKPLFKKNGYLNEAVDEENIRHYIYYTETKQPLTKNRTKENWYVLDHYNDTAYYFYYEKDKLTTLDLESLSIVKEKAEQYIIYADNCLLDKDYMMKHNIIFKKIPRDIKRF